MPLEGLGEFFTQARLLFRWLETTGLYRVVHAASGSEGEAMIRGREWDVIVHRRSAVMARADQRKPIGNFRVQREDFGNLNFGRRC